MRLAALWSAGCFVAYSWVMSMLCRLALPFPLVARCAVRCEYRVVKGCRIGEAKSNILVAKMCVYVPPMSMPSSSRWHPPKPRCCVQQQPILIVMEWHHEHVTSSMRGSHKHGRHGDETTSYQGMSFSNVARLELLNGQNG